LRGVFISPPGEEWAPGARALRVPPEKIVLARGTFYDLHLPDGSVDFVLLSQAFHHADRPGELLRKFAAF
jgi:ubiquinone/menaquinone biosynthesis C-methylase UbiE